jgi:mRNA-degrading endonuclease RelE of RelBE toxin-antitoxin system
MKENPNDFVSTLTNRNEFKLRVGDFRLFIELDRGELIILILKVGDRKTIYKKK